MYPAIASDLEEATSLMKFFAKLHKNNIDLGFVILRKCNKEFLGMIGIHELNEPMPTIGIWIKNSAQGYGFGKEALKYSLDYAKTLGYHSFLYPVDRRNIASKKIALDYNAQLIEPFHKVYTIDNKILEVEIYLIKI
ncbi:MAG: hypothetical protein ATN36_04235 [Epulopiscium sp. Nele67-Bin005]|nr:MAG: hypothetical protein ATN36_04235 [Epulopiscium sp. Nele67-Bin005]